MMIAALSSHHRRRRICGGLIAAAATTMMISVLLLFAYFFYYGSEIHFDSSMMNLERNSRTFSSVVHHRKLLLQPAAAAAANVDQPNRMWGERCSKSDIVVNQGPTAPLPNGIPTYTVEIMNVCASGCDISNIHLSCGWFSSARMINPRVFKRLGYDDCVVNDGKSLVNGGTLSFQYANTFRYPLSVSQINC